MKNKKNCCTPKGKCDVKIRDSECKFFEPCDDTCCSEKDEADKWCRFYYGCNDCYNDTAKIESEMVCNSQQARKKAGCDEE